jgi:demethylspheroidene O-methyltransferase
MKALDLAKPMGHESSRGPWRDRFDAWRDRLMTSPDVYRRTASNPLTRWMTRRRAREVFDLMAGFVYSQVLLACVRLHILEIVREAPRTLEELAQKCQVPASALQRLLNSAVALRLLELRGMGRYGLGPLGAPVAGHAGIRAMIEHHAVLYHDMQDPVALLRDQLDDAQMAAYWPYASDERHIGDISAAHVETSDMPNSWQSDHVSRYSQLMSASQPFVVDEVLATYRFDKHQCVLDVGGGQGTFVSRLARHAPQLELQLFDLPQVAALAQENFRQSGLSQRARAIGGDFLRDVLPEGADLVTLIRVAHDHPDDHVQTILRAIFQALPSGGTLLLAEPMAQPAGQAPLGDAYFHFYLLAMGAGRLRTADELGQMVLEAGFAEIELLRNPMPLQTRILVAKKNKYLP